jgi:tetratricopeptide (TPR) repeat protein
MDLRIILLGLLFLFTPPVVLAEQYIGNESCIDCHQTEVTNWQQSHHAKAMLAATDETVLGNFNSVKFESENAWTVFNRDEQGFYIKTGNNGEDGKRYAVPYVFGFYPLQQILVDIGSGKLQAYTVTWDSRSLADGGQRWYNLYSDTHIPDTPFDWKGQFNNWNARCAECHSTDLKRGYDVNTDSYNTTWSEINVSCEACHGPASEHLALKKAEKNAVNSGFEKPLQKHNDWVFASGESTAIRLQKTDISLDHGQPDQCAACHSRRVALTDGAGVGDFSQHYIPRLAVADLYHLDGQILDEVYVYGSFSQSKMASAGVVCSNCHEPHTGKTLSQDNTLCLQCHLPDPFATPEHTLHAQDSKGSLCIDCHMPANRYMGVDDRRDHAYRVPNPWVNELLGTPDVCLDCHQDKDSHWSQAQLQDKKGKIFADFSDIGSAVLLNQQDPHKGQALIAKLVADKNQPAMRRAVLLGYLDLQQSANLEVLNNAANDQQSLVKLGVIRALESAPYPMQLQIGFALLYDENKNVRLQAIRLLAPAFRQSLPEKAQKPIQDALMEAVVTYRQQQDLLSAQLALADLAYKIGDLQQAQIQYLNALKLQPSFLPAKLNLASIYRETNQLEKAKALLQQILELEENHAMALHNLGLIFVIEKQWPQALDALKRAAEIEPANPRFAFVYILGLEADGKIDEALNEVNKLQIKTPKDPALQELSKRLKKKQAP